MDSSIDFTQLQGALASESYDKTADICDELMLQVASQGIAFEIEWPYAIHLLGHFYVNDLNSARFLWKSIPPHVIEAQPEIVAVWKIGQCLWTRDYAGVFGAVRGFEWSAEVAGIITAFSANWWYLHGGDCPLMQNMAMKLLNLTSSSSGCERNWSTFEGIHTKKRNRLESKRLEDLVYVKFNSKLNQKKRGENKNLLLSNERSKARAWILEGAASDDEEEVHPGSGLTWRMVEAISGAAEVAENRRSSRLAGGPSSVSTSGIVHEEEPLVSDDDVSEEEDCMEMDSGEDSDDGAEGELHDDDD